jgi:hypothetical protein
MKSILKKTRLPHTRRVTFGRNHVKKFLSSDPVRLPKPSLEKCLRMMMVEDNLNMYLSVGSHRCVKTAYSNYLMSEDWQVFKESCRRWAYEKSFREAMYKLQDEAFEISLLWDNPVAHAAYHVYLKDLDWDEFKDTCSRLPMRIEDF